METKTQESIEKLADAHLCKLVSRDDSGEIREAICGSLDADKMEFIATSSGRKFALDDLHNVTIEAHPAERWLYASPYAIECDCADMRIYPTETGLANLTRAIGYCYGLMQSRNNQLERYAQWILSGLHRNLDYLGCSHNRLQYDAEGNDLQRKYPYDFDANEEEHRERLAKIESETVVTEIGTKKVLYGEDDYSFGWLSYYAIPHATYRAEIRKMQDDNPKMDYWEVESRVNTQLKINDDMDISKMRYDRLTERSYANNFVTHYCRGINGGLIQRFLETDYKKMKPHEEFHSYSVHS